jgi:hypothetical protein
MHDSEHAGEVRVVRARMRLKGFIRTEGTVSFKEASFMTLVVGWEREKMLVCGWVIW